MPRIARVASVTVFAGLVAVLIWAMWGFGSALGKERRAYEEQRARFFEQCLTELKEYECVAMWGQGRRR